MSEIQLYWKMFSFVIGLRDWKWQTRNKQVHDMDRILQTLLPRNQVTEDHLPWRLVPDPISFQLPSAAMSNGVSGEWGETVLDDVENAWVESVIFLHRNIYNLESGNKKVEKLKYLVPPCLPKYSYAYLYVSILTRPPVRLWRETTCVVNIVRPSQPVDNTHRPLFWHDRWYDAEVEQEAGQLFIAVAIFLFLFSSGFERSLRWDWDCKLRFLRHLKLKPNVSCNIRLSK